MEPSTQSTVTEIKVVRKNPTKIIGYILLSPAIISVLIFFIDLFTPGKFTLLSTLHVYWTGVYGYNDGGAGFTSALPFYFGLMAIAGAYLIKDKNS